MKGKIIVLFVSALTLSGCLNSNLTEPATEVSSNVDEISVSAEFIPGHSDDVRKLIISSNRSWFAHLNDIDYPVNPTDTSQSVKWGSVYPEEHHNLTANIEKTQLTVKFNRNISSSPVNGVLDIYSGGKIAKSIKISQHGAVFHLDASANRNKAISDCDTIHIAINCNTFWTAKVADESSARISLSSESGFDPSNLDVYFSDNLSTTDVKTAKVIISAENCEDCVLEFSQDRANSYLVLESAADIMHDPLDTAGIIIFKCNSDWTLTSNLNTFDGFALEKTSGTAAEGTHVKIPYTFTPADDPHTISEAKFTISSEAGDKVDFRIRQRGHFNIWFEKMLFSPALPTKASSSVAKGMSVTGGIAAVVEKETNRINFKFTTKAGNDYFLSADARMNGNDRYDSSFKSLTVNNNLGGNNPVSKVDGGFKGVPNYWKMPGVNGYILKHMIIHCVHDPLQKVYNRFHAVLYSDSFCYGPYAEMSSTITGRDTYVTYGVWSDGGLENLKLFDKIETDYTSDKDIIFDLTELNILQPAGCGITIVGGFAPPLQCHIRSIELIYEPENN